MPSPSPRSGSDPGDSLRAVAPAADGTAWAVGSTCTTDNRCDTLILRWNGTTWTQVPGPSPGTWDSLEDVSAAPDGTAWAVGGSCSGGGCSATQDATETALILHWNGTAWTQVPSPNPGHVPYYLHGVATGPAGSGWAVGGTSPAFTPAGVIVGWHPVR